MSILYTTEDGKRQIQVRAKDRTVWLSQREMARLFVTSADNIGPHLENIFKGRGVRHAEPLRCDQLITSIDFPLLDGKGGVSHEQPAFLLATWIARNAVKAGGAGGRLG